MIQIKTVKSEQVLTAAVKVLNNTWHRRFGVSFDEKCGSNKASCTVCCERKQTRLPFPQSVSKSHEVLELIRTDM